MLAQQQIHVDTHGRGTYDLSQDVQLAVRQSGIQSGICHVFIRHTSASFLRDLETFMSHLVSDGDPMFTHTAEGPDDMPAHVRSILTQSDLTIPVTVGRCALGTWQGIYLWEHRHRGHRRTVVVTVTGE
jgi:secondary thiamine-phosphate synthase enzyme